MSRGLNKKALVFLVLKNERPMKKKNNESLGSGSDSSDLGRPFLWVFQFLNILELF